MGPIYPDQQQPPDGWFWPLLLGWLAIACTIALIGWIAVSAVVVPGDQAVMPQSDVAAPSD